MNTELSFGMRGPEIGNWQQFLNSQINARLDVDEDFGTNTRVATAAYQSYASISIFPEIHGDRAGVVGALTRKQALLSGFIPFVPARNYTPILSGPARKIELIVIHTMESPDKPDTAENVAAWFAGPSAPKASAHFCVDTDSIVQCVRVRDIAWQAPGANHNGIGIEHAGYASQTEEDWKNTYNQDMLALSAKLVAGLCKEYNVPMERRSVNELKTGMAGLCGHIDITNAFNNGRGHIDPGPHFPWQDYIALVKANG